MSLVYIGRGSTYRKNFYPDYSRSSGLVALFTSRVHEIQVE